MIFFNKIRYSSNVVLRVMCRLHYYEALKLFSVFHIFPGYTSNVNIKRSIWYHLSSLVQLWFMYCIWSDLMLLILITDCVLYMLLFECVRTCNCFLLCCLCIFLSCAAFRCSAPSVWNSLPSFITNSGSLTTFNSRLKTHFFRLVFDCSVHVWPHHISASASKVTTLWRYINQFIIIIIIFIKKYCPR